MAEERDYLQIIEQNRSGGVEHAATTPVFYERPAKRRLTKNRKRAKLLKSASDTKRAAKSRRRTKKSSSSRRSPKMASKKQKAAARRNIKKAQAAKRAKAASRSRAAKKAARTRKAKHSHKAARKSVKRARKSRKSSKRSRAAKKAARTRKANKAARKAARKSSRKSRKSSRRPKHSRRARKSSRRSRKTRRSMSMKIPRKSRKVYVVAAEKSRRRHRRGHSRRRGAMENPMTGVEIFVGSITGLAGFGLADFVDRMLATHALTDKNAKNADGQELYADNPPADGNYIGLFNPTAICAPMDWKRWVFGLLGAAVPLGAAQLVSGPTARSALQFFGFGYGVRVVGKGLIDGLALLTKSTGMGQRLYDGEMRASVLKANNGNNQANELASLPAAGLGQPKQLAGTPCKDCGDKQQAAGAGYPSMPREVTSQTQPQPTSQATPPAPPPAPATPPAAFNPGPLTGTPSNGAPKKRSPYAWGETLS